MPGYAIADIEVLDPEGYTEYRRLSPEVLKRLGARYLVLTNETEVKEGDWHPHRLVLIEFESLDQARAWYESAEYRPARDVRQRTARTRLLLAAGHPG